MTLDELYKQVQLYVFNENCFFKLKNENVGFLYGKPSKRSVGPNEERLFYWKKHEFDSDIEWNKLLKVIKPVQLVNEIDYQLNKEIVDKFLEYYNK